MNEPVIDWSLVDRVRNKNPVVLTLANLVTIGKVADAVNAIGASPIMSFDLHEAAELVKLADAIAINLGTINDQQMAQIKAVLQAADRRLPLILDPVAVAAVPYRLTLAQQLLQQFSFDVIRGNASEIAALIGEKPASHGIDTGMVKNQAQIAMECARQFKATVILTGEVDLITDGHRLYRNSLTTPFLAANVGSGDILTSITAAFLTVGTDSWMTGIVATIFLTSAGVLASRHASGLGSWQVQFFDQLSLLDAQTVQTFSQERKEDYLD